MSLRFQQALSLLIMFLLVMKRQMKVILHSLNSFVSMLTQIRKCNTIETANTNTCMKKIRLF